MAEETSLLDKEHLQELIRLCEEFIVSRTKSNGRLSLMIQKESEKESADLLPTQPENETSLHSADVWYDKDGQDYLSDTVEKIEKHQRALRTRLKRLARTWCRTHPNQPILETTSHHLENASNLIHDAALDMLKGKGYLKTLKSVAQSFENAAAEIGRLEPEPEEPEPSRFTLTIEDNPDATIEVDSEEDESEVDAQHWYGRRGFCFHPYATRRRCRKN